MERSWKLPEDAVASLATLGGPWSLRGSRGILYRSADRVAFRALGSGLRFDVPQRELGDLRYSKWIGGPSLLCRVGSRRYRIGFHQLAGLRYPDNFAAPEADPLVRDLALAGSREELCSAWLALLGSKDTASGH